MNQSVTWLLPSLWQKLFVWKRVKGCRNAWI
jgi:hypothetical protein